MMMNGFVPACKVGSRIKSAVQQLGTGCIELVQDAGSLQLNPNAGIARRDLGVHARKVLEHVRYVFYFSLSLQIQVGYISVQVLGACQPSHFWMMFLFHCIQTVAHFCAVSIFFSDFVSKYFHRK